MPRPPHTSAAVAGMPGAVFSRIASRMQHMDPAGIYPLHVGDTWMEPLEGTRVEDFKVSDHPGLHRYTSPQGHPALLAAALEKVNELNRLPIEPGGVLATAGATGGLGAALGMLLDPGDEVIILAPFWPLIRGIVQANKGVALEAPFYPLLEAPDDAIESVRARIGPRTVALYVSTPSNPTGRVIPPALLQQLAELAREHDLWLLSDEIYEQYAYRGQHASIGQYAPERTLTAFSFSKAYGMTGNRTGYLVGPSEAIAATRKVSTHSFYSAPTVGQLAGVRALRDGQPWVDRAFELYKSAGDEMADILGVPRPEGSTFFFLDASHKLDERGIWGFLEDCLEDGLVLAPGPSFGQDYDTFVRICFTSAPPERTAEAARLLAARLR
jgi:aspartate/methionine/tyrosine aminotransferase